MWRDHKKMAMYRIISPYWMQLSIYNCRIILCAPPTPSVRLGNSTTHSSIHWLFLKYPRQYFATSRTNITDMTHTHTKKYSTHIYTKHWKYQVIVKGTPYGTWHENLQIFLFLRAAGKGWFVTSDNCAIHAGCVQEVSERQTQNGSANGWVFATIECQFKEYFLLDLTRPEVDWKAVVFI